MSDKKTIVEALFEVQRKINEQRMKNSIDNYNAVNEQALPSWKGLQNYVKGLFGVELPDYPSDNKAVPPSDTSFKNTEPGYSGTQGKILDYNRQNPQPPSARLPVNNGQVTPQAPAGRPAPQQQPAANTAMPPPPQRPPAQQPAANTAMPSTREPTGNDLYRTPGSQSDAPPERAARTDLRPLVNRGYGARVARPDAATLLDRQQNKDFETMRNSNDPTLGSRENQLVPNSQTPPTTRGIVPQTQQDDAPPLTIRRGPEQLSGPGYVPRVNPPPPSGPEQLSGPGYVPRANSSASTREPVQLSGPPKQLSGPAPAAQRPAQTPPPRPAPAVQRPAPPPRPTVDPNARSKEMFQSYQNRKDQGDDSAASFFAADAQRMKEQGQRTPNDFSQEESGKTKGKNKMYESNNPMIAAFLALQEANPENMFEAMKRAKKDYDKDGKIESEKDEVWGSRFRAARKAGEMKEASTTDPDLRPDAPGSENPTRTLRGKSPNYKAPNKPAVSGTGDDSVYGGGLMIVDDEPDDLPSPPPRPKSFAPAPAPKQNAPAPKPAAPAPAPKPAAPAAPAAPAPKPAAPAPAPKPAAPAAPAPKPAAATPPLPPVRPKNLRETEEIDEALAHDMDAGELRQHLATKYGHIEDGHPVTVTTRRTYMHHVNRLSKMIGMHPDKVRKQVKKDYANMDDMKNEEVENLDEVGDTPQGRNKLRDYLKNAKQSGDNEHMMYQMSKAMGNEPDSDNVRALKNRGKGIRSANRTIKNQMNREEVGFSDAELAHFASVFETAVAPQTDSNAADVGQRPQSEILDEGGRRRDREENPNVGNGRDPRQHVELIAGQAAAGRKMKFRHNDGTTSDITPAMGRAITAHLQGLKPAERQAAVNKMHDSADGLRG